MKVLVTGSKGQVGFFLTKQLAGKADVLAVDRDELDITDQAGVNSVVTTFKPDVIINAAAHTAVDKAESEIELSYKINRDGPMYLAQAANKVGAAILHISTDYVFSGDKESAYLETDAPDPQGVYGQSKLAGELVVAESCPRHIILRTAWVFSEHGNNFVKTMLRLGAEREELGIVGDQFGGPTYAGDIAAALITIADKIYTEKECLWGTYHFSGVPHVSWFEFAEAIFEQAQKQGVLKATPRLKSITTQDYPTPAKRPANSKLECRQIKESFCIIESNWLLQLNALAYYS
ncbi:dTDP-4-dehydrorhamnose reductase [Motilimonas cestriensis]|uniref:dTDP-4-dehydrorhamnose reductase n=1 Tax=Motilimonas cestriensis TaxID=2742685 RepID=UPI003DA3D0A0